MKSQTVILLVLLSPVFLFAQEDTTLSKRSQRDKINNTDSSKKKLLIAPQLPPRTLIIKMKDLKEIKNLEDKPFIVIDDTSQYTAEELAIGLSEEELANYKKNKEEIKHLLIQPPSEEETYPTVSTIRKILSVAKTAGVILILILSLL